MQVVLVIAQEIRVVEWEEWEIKEPVNHLLRFNRIKKNQTEQWTEAIATNNLKATKYQVEYGLTMKPNLQTSDILMKV